jgi:hypothetical protein
MSSGHETQLNKFLLTLNELFLESIEKKKPISIVMKRFSFMSKKNAAQNAENYKHLQTSEIDSGSNQVYTVLVRAVLGKKKLSTHVSSYEFKSFNSDLMALSKTHMSSLKKKDKNKKK